MKANHSKYIQVPIYLKKWCKLWWYLSVWNKRLSQSLPWLTHWFDHTLFQNYLSYRVQWILHVLRREHYLNVSIISIILINEKRQTLTKQKIRNVPTMCHQQIKKMYYHELMENLRRSNIFNFNKFETKFNNFKIKIMLWT